MKEKFGFLSQNYKREVAQATFNKMTLEKSYTLPDGQTVTLSSERFR